MFNGSIHYQWPCSSSLCNKLPEGISKYHMLLDQPTIKIPFFFGADLDLSPRVSREDGNMRGLCLSRLGMADLRSVTGNGWLTG